MPRPSPSPEFIETNKAKDRFYDRFYMTVCAPAAIFLSYKTMEAFLDGNYLLALLYGGGTIGCVNLFNIGLNGRARQDWEELIRFHRNITETISDRFKK